MKTLYKQKRILILWIWISFFVHAIAFSYFFEIAPLIKKRKEKKNVYYVDMVNFGGGGRFPKTSRKTVKKTSPQKPSSMKELEKASEKTKKKPEMTYSKPVKKIKKVKKTRKYAKRKKFIRKPKKSELKKAFETVKKTINEYGEDKGSGDVVGFGLGDSQGGVLGSFPFLYYIEIVRNRISSNWITGSFEGRLPEGTLVIISFKILRSGRIENVKIEKSSGIRAYDLSSIRAIYNSSPFPPLPSSYSGDYLLLVIQFKLRRKI